MIRKKVTITDSNGLHARPVAMLARRVRDFQADTRLITAKGTVEAGDLFAVLGCEVLCGEEIEVGYGTFFLSLPCSSCKNVVEGKHYIC